MPARCLSSAAPSSGIQSRAGYASEDDLHRAALHLEEAARLFVEAGHREQAAGLVPYRALRVELALGHPGVALEILDEALALVVERPRRTATILGYRGEVLVELGRYDECEAGCREVLRIAEQLGEPHCYQAAFAEWLRMEAASRSGDAEATLEHARAVEQRRGDWWGVAGPDFLADAADCLDMVGHTALAREYLDRAHADPGDARPMIAMAECALLARHGDPELAEERLAAVSNVGIEFRERWRVTLLRAYAAYRRGAEQAGGLAAHAFEEAARLGQPLLPMSREREVTEALLGLAVATGKPAAAALETASLPVGLAVLGRFELTRGGRAVDLPPGKASSSSSCSP